MKSALKLLPDLTLSNYADLDHSGSFDFAPFQEKLKFGGHVGAVPLMVDVKDLRRIPGYNVRVKGALYRNRVEKLATLMLDHGFDEASPLVGMLGREGADGRLYQAREHAPGCDRDSKCCRRGHPPGAGSVVGRADERCRLYPRFDTFEFRRAA